VSVPDFTITGASGVRSFLHLPLFLKPRAPGLLGGGGGGGGWFIFHGRTRGGDRGRDQRRAAKPSAITVSRSVAGGGEPAPAGLRGTTTGPGRDGWLRAAEIPLADGADGRPSVAEACEGEVIRGHG